MLTKYFFSLNRACKVFVTASSVKGPSKCIKSSISQDDNSVTLLLEKHSLFFRISKEDRIFINVFIKKIMLWAYLEEMSFDLLNDFPEA